MWQTVAGFHAAANDLPAALFVAALGFDIAGFVTKKESLHTAAFWTLMVAAGGSIVAVVSGLRASGIIDHDAVMHRSMMRHRNLAIGFTALAVGLSTWRIARRTVFTARDVKPFLAVSVLSALILIWSASLGGKLVFQHAGGIETTVLEAVVVERQAGHAHSPEAGHAAADHEHNEGNAMVPDGGSDTTTAGNDGTHSH
jgi:uncharacterized membrane protein